MYRQKRLLQTPTRLLSELTGHLLIGYTKIYADLGIKWWIFWNIMYVTSISGRKQFKAVLRVFDPRWKHRLHTPQLKVSRNFFIHSFTSHQSSVEIAFLHFYTHTSCTPISGASGCNRTNIYLRNILSFTFLVVFSQQMVDIQKQDDKNNHQNTSF